MKVISYFVRTEPVPLVASERRLYRAVGAAAVASVSVSIVALLLCGADAVTADLRHCFDVDGPFEFSHQLFQCPDKLQVLQARYIRYFTHIERIGQSNNDS